jgi:hypothetical protein
MSFIAGHAARETPAAEPPSGLSEDLERMRRKEPFTGTVLRDIRQQPGSQLGLTSD